jgi:YidC/Oxa1 family membrane protein insertase
MTAIVIAPSFFLKRNARPPAPVPAQTDGRMDGATDGDTAAAALADSAGVGEADLPTLRPSVSPSESAPALAEDTVLVSSDLYQYGFSTRGGRLVKALLQEYRYTLPGRKDDVVDLLRDDSRFMALQLVDGRDTLRLDDWMFTPSATALDARQGGELVLVSERGGVRVELRYRFRPEDYRMEVAGTLTGLGPNGGLLLVGMGPGLRNTESDSTMNFRETGIVTEQDGTDLTRLQSLDAGETRVLPGPFDWVALKSKYFVQAVLALDTARARISGVTATAPAGAGRRPHEADIRLGVPLTQDGSFGWDIFLGPMEYDRLAAIGHDFDDVNPYGWPGFRTVIRPLAVGARWLLVWMHEHLALSYGLVLVAFGILVRLVLWPLNQKAMRSGIAMQAIQGPMKELQEKHKDNPTKLQQEMMKLYKEHGVNPLGGCVPMLIPMPVLFALFFVFQNTIELRGVSFLWIPDLSIKDPLYIIPIVMGASMFALSKLGQLGMEPTPQTKMMLYFMPAIFTVMFLQFPAGLNLYYAVSNIASLPQQWLIAKERKRRIPVSSPKPAPPAAPPAKASSKRK